MTETTPIERVITDLWVKDDMLSTVTGLMGATVYALAIGSLNDAADIMDCAKIAVELANEEQL